MFKKVPIIIYVALLLFACREEIDKSNRYVFTGETVADFLLNRSEEYSHFITILKQAEMMSLLKTYGQYTLFLPTNEAVEKFLIEQDSLYWATRDDNVPYETGITSPHIEDLSDSMATVIAKTHLVEARYPMAEMNEGTLHRRNFNQRSLGINYKVVDERFYIMINNRSAIIDGDNEVENGIVHLIDKPIDPKYRTVSNQIAAHPFFSIFTQAISETGFESKVSATVDLNYIPPAKLVFPQYYYNSIPQYRYFKFTAFVEPDEVFHKYGIYTLDDLKAFAEKWYGTKEKGNYKNPENALYKFVAYHFVEGEIPYNRVVLSRSGTYSNGNIYTFDYYYMLGMDLYNYYPTLQGTLLKALKPLSTTDGLNIYLNYSKRKIPYNFEMRNHTNVRIIEVTEFTQMNERYAGFVPTAGNGLIHPIDKILIYNENEMVGNILDERMRFDYASLQPELSSNNIWQTDNVEIPIDYCKGIKTFSGKNSGVYGYHGGDYNLDCIDFLGSDFRRNNNFDHAVLLPPVPPRTYEIRISSRGGSGLYNNRTTAKYQLYFDDKICGSPIPTHPIPTDPEIGWVADEDTYDNGVENDKHLRNKGWMKAPDSYYIDGISGIRETARSSYNRMRKIIHRQYIGKGEHWLRYRYIPPKYLEGFSANVSSLDYIEFVPLHIVSDPSTPEDRH